MKPIDSGFAPILGASPRVLILGTMPSVRSLEDQQYYAHPRNSFWWIMSQLFYFDIDSIYSYRCEVVKKHGLAIWDVIGSCYRPGSLDANIDQSTLQANNFSTLFGEKSKLRVIAFNGQAAEKLFHKHVVPDQREQFSGETIVLPSTSPANAAMNKEAKLAWWRAILDYL